MREKIWIQLLFVLGFFLFSWWLFSQISCSKFLPNKDFHLISVEQEVKLGKVLLEYMQEYEVDMQAEPDTALIARLDRVKARLLPQLDSNFYDFNIYVSRSKQCNAITLPGGNIIVFKGLMDFVHSDMELAGVVAHEIGHAQKRHTVSKLTQQLGVSILLAVVVGGDLNVLHEIAQMLLGNFYSRSLEAEADDFACKLMVKSHLPPNALAAFFERLKLEHGDMPDALQFLNTHPGHDDRIQKMQSYPLPEGFYVDSFPALERSFNFVQDTLTAVP